MSIETRRFDQLTDPASVANFQSKKLLSVGRDEPKVPPVPLVVVVHTTSPSLLSP